MPTNQPLDLLSIPQLKQLADNADVKVPKYIKARIVNKLSEALDDVDAAKALHEAGKISDDELAGVLSGDESEAVAGQADAEAPEGETQAASETEGAADAGQEAGSSAAAEVDSDDAETLPAKVKRDVWWCPFSGHSMRMRSEGANTCEVSGATLHIDADGNAFATRPTRSGDK